MPLIVTPGSASATSYCSEAEAERYHEAHIGGLAWLEPASPAIEDLREPALIQATRMLDATFDWAGRVASESQALGWPRTGAYDRQGRLLPSQVIPQAIKEATAELAMRLIAGADADTELQALGITSVKAGSVAVEFDSAQATPAPTIPDDVFYLIGDLGTLRSRGSGSVRLVRV